MQSKMREICDKHFYDNWVLPYYMGYTIYLTDQWQPYKAAKAALANTVELQNVKDLTTKYLKKMDEYYKKCQEYLVEGVLTEDFVLDKVNNLLVCLRESNITVRWLMLHR